MTETKKESFNKGMLYTLLSGTALSVLGLFAKIGSEFIPITGLIFWRFLTAFLIGIGGAWLTGHLKGLLKMNAIGMHFLRAFFLLTAQYSYFYYLSKNSLMNATVLLSTGPIFIPIIEWAILRKYVGKSTWISIGVSFLGVLFVIKPDAAIFSSMSLIGLMSGLGQGASQTIFGMTAKEKDPYLGVVHLMLICAGLSLIPYLFFDAVRSHDRVFEERALILALGLGSLVNQFTRVAAYNHAPPSRVSVFLYISVLFAALFDWLFYGDTPTPLSAIGAALVVFGGILKIYLRALFLAKK